LKVRHKAQFPAQIVEEFSDDAVDSEQLARAVYALQYQ
jgi:hypothetical protein